MFAFWKKSSTPQKIYYMTGAVTLASCVAIVPAAFFGYGAAVGMTSLLFGWTTVRTWHYTKEKAKQNLQSQIQALKNEGPISVIAPSTGNNCQEHLYSTGRVLAASRGYSGLVASFSATVFPTQLARTLIETFGTAAASSIYLENIIETFRLQQEITIKKQINDSLRASHDSSDNAAPTLVNEFPNAAKISLAILLLSGSAIGILASPVTFGIKSDVIPDEVLPATVIMTLLSLLFTNRFCISSLRKNLGAYNKNNNELTQKISHTIDLDEQPQNIETPLLPPSQQYKKLVPLSYLFQGSALTRGTIGTTLTVSAFFKILIPEETRALGSAILIFNFLETGLEIYMVHLERKLLEQEHSALAQSRMLTQ